MFGRVYWRTCHHPGCLDRMTPSPDPEQVRRDQQAHIAAHHGGYRYTDIELRLSSWRQPDAVTLSACPSTRLDTARADAHQVASGASLP